MAHQENRKITFFTYGFTYARHGDPGIVNWPWGAVLGARWPFLIPAQRHFVKDQEVGAANPALASRFRSQLRASFNRN